MNNIILTCVYGRLTTFRRCVDLTPLKNRLVVYSDKVEDKYIKDLGIDKRYRYNNSPLSDKWNHGVKMLENYDFDNVIMMGADNYFDQSFLDFVNSEMQDNDLLAFKDLYFEDARRKMFYWSGYKGTRQNEPAGAGKVYSRKFLEKINFDLFPVSKDNGLDGQSWVVCKHHNAKIKIVSLKENNLMLVDIKDGQGITPLDSIANVTRCTEKD